MKRTSPSPEAGDLEGGMDVNVVGSLVSFPEQVYASLKNEMDVISQFLIKLEVSNEEGRAIHDAATLKIVRDAMEKDMKEVSETVQSIIEKLEQLDTVHASNNGCKKGSSTDQCLKYMRNSYITQVEEVLNVVTSLAGVEKQSMDGEDSFTYSGSDTDSMISMRKRLERLRMVDSLAGVEIQRVDTAEVFIIQLQGVAKRFNYDELQMATRGFSEKLGDGGFGNVYRGVLPPRIPVAVKRMNAHSTHGQGMKEFRGEVSIITQLRHRNLIELQGWCEDQARKEYMLVYELMPNGSLDNLLFKYSVKQGGAAVEEGTEARGGKSGVLKGTFCLSWPQRFNILTGIADALDYLHQGWKHQVIHGDIKCANILLDKEWNAKLTDFGLSRLVDHQGEAYTIHFAGTRGYAAPELFTEGKFTAKSDVFAFGVVVLEVVCGRRNWPGDAHEMSLVEWVRERLNKGDVIGMVDKELRGFDKHQVETVLMIGLACCDIDHRKRPSMRLIVKMLAGERYDELMEMMVVKEKVEDVRGPSKEALDGEDFSTSHALNDQERDNVAYVLPPPPPPQLLPLPPKWKEAIDLESGHRYYYSPETNESSWERPKAGIVIADQNKKPENSSTGPRESLPYTAVPEFRKPARYESIEKGKNIVEHDNKISYMRRGELSPCSSSSRSSTVSCDSTETLDRGQNLVPSSTRSDGSPKTRTIVIAVKAYERLRLEPFDYAFNHLIDTNCKVVVISCLSRLQDTMGVDRPIDVETFGGVSKKMLDVAIYEQASEINNLNHFLKAFREKLDQKGVPLDIRIIAGPRSIEMLVQCAQALHPHCVVLDRYFSGAQFYWSRRKIQAELECNLVVLTGWRRAYARQICYRNNPKVTNLLQK